MSLSPNPSRTGQSVTFLCTWLPNEDDKTIVWYIQAKGGSQVRTVVAEIVNKRLAHQYVADYAPYISYQKVVYLVQEDITTSHKWKLIYADDVDNDKRHQCTIVFPQKEGRTYKSRIIEHTNDCKYNKPSRGHFE